MANPEPIPIVRRHSWKRRLLVQLALVPVAALAVEGVYRGWLAYQGESYRSAQSSARACELVSSMRQSIPQSVAGNDAGDSEDSGRAAPTSIEKVFLHPFLGFEYEQASASLQSVLEPPTNGERDDGLDVLIVGGSVAGGFAQLGAQALESAIHADPRFAERKICFTSGGRGSWKQPQQTILVQQLLARGYRPDLVIDLDGFNEVALSAQNVWEHAHPLYPSVFKWAHLARHGDFDPRDVELLAALQDACNGADALVARAARWHWMDSAVLGRLTLRRIHAIRNRWVEAQQRYGRRLIERGGSAVTRGEKFTGDLAAGVKLAVEHWAESSRQLHAVCALYGVRYLHVLQPTLHDTGSKPLTKRELESDNAHQSWIEGVHLGYPLLREAGRKLVESGVHFVDASMTFEHVDKTLYFDACHFRTLGNSLLAEAIAPQVIELLAADPTQAARALPANALIERSTPSAADRQADASKK